MKSDFFRMAKIEDFIEPAEVMLKGFKKAFILIAEKMRLDQMYSFNVTQILQEREQERFKNALKELRRYSPTLDHYYSEWIKKDVEEFSQTLTENLHPKISKLLCRDYELMVTYLVGNKDDKRISAMFLAYQHWKFPNADFSPNRFSKSIKVAYWYFRSHNSKLRQANL